MNLFLASTEDWPAGHVFPIRTEPSTGHLNRVANNESWRQMEEALEARRHASEQARATAYFACAKLGECAKYMESQQWDLATGMQIDTRPIRYYRVEMPAPTRAPMRLCYVAMRHLNDPLLLDEIAAEYWRQPRRKWEYFEYLGTSMQILEAVAAPSPGEVMVASMSYENDIMQAREAWPTRPKV